MLIHLWLYYCYRMIYVCAVDLYLNVTYWNFLLLFDYFYFYVSKYNRVKFWSDIMIISGAPVGVNILMEDRSGALGGLGGVPRHHTLPHGSSTLLSAHPSAQPQQHASPTPVMPVVPQPPPTALVSPTQLGHHPSGPSPTNTYNRTGTFFTGDSLKSIL